MESIGKDEKVEKRLVTMQDVGKELVAWQAKSTRKSYAFWAKKYEVWKAAECPNSEDNEDTLTFFALGACHKYAASSLWSAVSHIKKYIRVEKNVSLGDMRTLHDFLKRNSERQVGKKSKIFRREEVEKFLQEAPETHEMLVCKLALVLGFYGCMRMGEIHALRLNDMKVCEEGIEVVIRKSKTDQAGRGRVVLVPRSEDKKMCGIEILRKYLEMVGRDVGEDTQLWWQSRHGKVHDQTIGRNSLSKTPRRIAQFLELEDPQGFTGHAFRGSSATAMVEGGVDITTMKDYGRWRSASIAESYVRPSKRVRLNAVSAMTQSNLGVESTGGKAQAMFSNCVFRDCVVNLSADSKVAAVEHGPMLGGDARE